MAYYYKYFEPGNTVSSPIHIPLNIHKTKKRCIEVACKSLYYTSCPLRRAISSNGSTA